MNPNTNDRTGAAPGYRADPPPRRSRGGFITIFVLLIALVVAVAFASGLLNVDASGDVKLPDVAVKGGELPDVQVETGKVDVGTKTETIELPTVNVEKADDDGSAKR